MKKTVVAFLLCFSCSARADMWGGDLIYLAQILENAIRQLTELRNIVGTGKDTLDLLRDINRGVNDSLNLVRTVYPNLDPGIYKDWQSVSDALSKLEHLYGVVGNSPASQIFKDADNSAAEAISLNNQIYKYSQQIDEIGEAVKEYSHQVSPGGAQKLTAQAMGIMLHVMNQSLRTQATGLKLQAQTLAIQNKKEKDATNSYLEQAQTLTKAMKTRKTEFQTPRFQ